MVARNHVRAAHLLWNDQTADDDEGLPDLVDIQA
jgi:hypothetical protein